MAQKIHLRNENGEIVCGQKDKHAAALEALSFEYIASETKCNKCHRLHINMTTSGKLRK